MPDTPSSKPRKQRVDWTQKEETIFVNAIKKHGANFHLFLPLLPDRNLRQIRKHYHDKENTYVKVKHGGSGRNPIAEKFERKKKEAAAASASSGDSKTSSSPSKSAATSTDAALKQNCPQRTCNAATLRPQTRLSKRRLINL